MTTQKTPAAAAQMLIRKPAPEVFNAFVDPEITKNFWFTKGSDKLETGKKVTWEWEMYNVIWTVTATEMIKDEKIILDESPAPTMIEFNFRTVGDGATYVTVKQYGFTETGDALVEKIKGATGGWTTVLDGAKIFLEHQIHPNFVADKFPKEAGINIKD
ncbi:polyketide cyclase [Niabella ginsenosidivorans]|uniref:Polyketide cyclase n=1 Tax=Niabella ginsenosidivorans TaxID=1176587 RepID=A0A1A9HYN1_9BACT|nr:SRPBCC domain-containing protein [Niabella ginsenosidivorans]ANH80486.1 polyketide cyclase [Niabella ginsenosidivorans]